MCCDYDYFEDLIYELDPLGEDGLSIDVSDITHEATKTPIDEYTAAL